MKLIIAIFTATLMSSCTAESNNKVGYGKRLNEAVDEKCFANTFQELSDSTNYVLAIETEKEEGKMTFYHLIIDGTQVIESHDIFTPKSFNIAKQFTKSVVKNCTA